MLYIYVHKYFPMFFSSSPPQIYVSPTLITKKSLLQKVCFERRSSTPPSRVARHVWEILTSQKPAMKRRGGEGKWATGMHIFSCGKGRF